MKKILILLMLSFAQGWAHLPDSPWIAPRAVRFLDQYLEEHPDAHVLEFGSGYSTLWLAKRTRNLYSVEHHLRWYQKISQLAANSSEYHPFNYFLLDTPYYHVAEEFEDEFFDVIFVDGRNRKGCIAHSISKLKSGGLLILDDGERKYYHAVFPLMRGWPADRDRRDPKRIDPCTTYWWIKP